ncbi:glycoside hydrolase family 3 C-terminal domain-containing protein [Spirillospora sp. CA-294931]|uniref:glycoside hydrolase family 3 protein n=1 Tax=Spirillospora sp. CA-294931 TaxID=3240042 RepID=UPI003D8E5245
MTTVDEADLRRRLARLTLEQKVRLLTGADFWTLHPVQEVGLRRIVMSDGPSGVRGTAWDEREPGLLFPNPTALAATWDVDLAERVGRLNGAQARDKGVHVQLAPTINLHRTPLGGRHFENYSEDPLLVARIATAFVTGLQSTGVAAAVKHFVGNDSETARMSYDARIDGRTLDELYLRPFRATVEAGAWMVMAAYNQVNGAPMTENGPLLIDLLKGAWGFDGVVVSDWTAVRSTEAAANGGTDLEMPGTRHSRWGDRLAEAVRAGRVAEELVDDKVLRVLRLAARVGALEGYPGPPPVATPPDARLQLRGLAARACVLLRNEGGVLPLNSPRTLALIGPNAVRFGFQGGGSAHVNPTHTVTPEEGLRRVMGEATRIEVRTGVRSHERLAPLPLALATDPESGEPGFRLEFLDAGGAVLDSQHRLAAHYVLLGSTPEGTAEIVARAGIAPERDGVHTFSIDGSGHYEFRVGDTRTAVDHAFAGVDAVETLTRPPEHRVEVELRIGEAVPVEVRHPYRPGSFEAAVFWIGYQAPVLPEDEELAAAVEAAREAEVAVVVVGTTDEVESEGFDRTTLALPGRQDELVSAVAAVNPRTVVVVNAGAPVLMPWRDEVAAVLWAWLPGQEGGEAIAEVLAGAAEPGGRLPTTFPATETGVLSPLPAEDGTLEYSEGTAIGYRHYDPADVAYPFGHGLGYTTWEYVAMSVPGDDKAEVVVRNAGERPGREVVQVYAEDNGEPPHLVGFAVVEAPPGDTVTAHVPLDGPAPGRRLRAGRSLHDLRLATGQGNGR